MPTDKEIILTVELVRVLLNAAFTLAETAKLSEKQIDALFMETYKKVKQLDPIGLPDVEE